MDLLKTTKPDLIRKLQRDNKIKDMMILPVKDKNLNKYLRLHEYVILIRY